MAAAIASGLIRQKRQAREQHAHRPTTHRRRKSPGKKQGLCNGNLVDIFSKVRIFGLKKRRLRRQGVRGHWGADKRAHAYTQTAARALFHTHMKKRTHARTRTFTRGDIHTQPPSHMHVLAGAHARALVHAHTPQSCINTD